MQPWPKARRPNAVLIEALIGQLDTQQLLIGLGMQALWVGVGGLLVRLVWRLGVRQFASVGN